MFRAESLALHARLGHAPQVVNSAHTSRSVQQWLECRGITALHTFGKNVLGE